MQPARGESSHRPHSAPPVGYPMRRWRPSSSTAVYTSPQGRATLCPHTPSPEALCNDLAHALTHISTPPPPHPTPIPLAALRGRIFHSGLESTRLYMRKQLHTHSLCTCTLPYRSLNFHKVISKFPHPWPTSCVLELSVCAITIWSYVGPNLRTLCILGKHSYWGKHPA